MNAPQRMKQFRQEDREALRSLYAAPYMHGLCGAFAIAVARRTGWLMAGLRGSECLLLHVGVEAPGSRYLDVRGYHDEKGFAEPFGGTLCWVDEETLLAEHPHVGEEEIGKAAALAGLLVDGLPGDEPMLSRLDDFAADLEELSRKHGIWIRAEGPHGIPAYDGCGDETGYEFSIGPTGDARIDRAPFRQA